MERHIVVNVAFLLMSINRVSSNQFVGVLSEATFNGAQSFCQSTCGSSLATITSSENNDAVVNAALDAGITSNNIWIGLSDFNTAGGYVWNDGTGDPFYYFTNFGSNALNSTHFNEEQFAMRLNIEGQPWITIPASINATKPFVCNNPKYIGVNLQLNFVDAQLYCQDMFNSSLATIGSQDGNDKAFNEAVDTIGSSNNGIWIGLYNVDERVDPWNVDSTNYSWVDGSRLSWVNWADTGNNDIDLCTKFTNDSTGTWENVECANKNYFVCNTNNTLTTSSVS